MLGMLNHSNCAHVHSTLGHLPNYNPNMTKKDQIIISKNSLPVSTFLLVLFSSPRTSSYLIPLKPKWINRCPWCICSRLMSQWIRFADRSGSLETSPERLGIHENLLPGTLATKKKGNTFGDCSCELHFTLDLRMTGKMSFTKMLHPFSDWYSFWVVICVFSPKHHYLTKDLGIHLDGTLL